MDKEWYIVSTFAGQELKVKQQLKTMIERENVQDYFGEIEIPHKNEERISTVRGKRRSKVIRKNDFPCYVFIEMNMNDKSRGLVQNVQGIMGFVGVNKSNKAPMPVSKDEMNRILGRKSEGEDIITQVPFSIGDSIRIIEGPFNGFTGTVEEIMNDGHKLKTMVAVFGRSIPVELSFTSVELI